MNDRQQAKQRVIEWLRQNTDKAVTDDEVRAVIQWATSVPPDNSMAALLPAEMESLLHDIYAECNIWVRGSLLQLRTPHRDWLAGRRSSICWYYWNSYRDYLSKTGELADEPQKSMDRDTDLILSDLGDPAEPGEWDRRGMVVGRIQSGKTGNYIGLINKALDAGYKLIVVLAGTQEDLRSQTQQRVDLGVLGMDTRAGESAGPAKTALIGVGKYRPQMASPFVPTPLTDASPGGDLTRRKFTQVAIGGSPLVLVVKKNVLILRRILEWVRRQPGKPESDRDKAFIHNVPLLLIDDEADNASIDVAPPANGKGKMQSEKAGLHDPSAINGLIRKILTAFDQRAYVGYTATPFANVLIYPEDTAASANGFGSDLFPRDFIMDLPSPSNYVGPTEVFGLGGIDDDEDEGPRGLPLVRYVEDEADFIPKKHGKDLEVVALPRSLVEAVRSFVLVIAARSARGDDRCDNSMLVHVTRFVNVQHHVFNLVDAEVASMRRVLELQTGEGYKALMKDLEAQWQEQFEQRAERLRVENKLDFADLPSWTAVKSRLFGAVAKIHIRRVNGLERDPLDYYRYEDTGLSVIAVGGDKLSRGMTLKDLSVSYFLRASTMYDTLLQMGRWFGYKDGFLELCSLYTTRELASWYRWIAGVDLELRDEFAAMDAENRAPEEYGLRIRKHPSVLKVTAAIKMRSAREEQVSYADSLAETYVFSLSAGVQEKNFEALASWVDQLPPVSSAVKGGPRWDAVTPEMVIGLLQRFSVHEMCQEVNSANVTEYIRQQNGKGELLEWTVCLISVREQTKTKTRHTRKVDVGTYEIWTPLRNPPDEISQEQRENHEYHLRNDHLMSRTDEARDLSEAEKKEALRRTTEAWDKQHPVKGRGSKAPSIPGAHYIRQVRPSTRGLLLIYALDQHIDPLKNDWKGGREALSPIVGIAMSFPGSSRAVAVKYVVNETYWRHRRGEEDDERDDLE
jgi:hypothetical protein